MAEVVGDVNARLSQWLRPACDMSRANSIFVSVHNNNTSKMSNEIEMDNLTAKREHAVVDDKPGGRLNLDIHQEASVTLWAYVATAM
jgi:hypothetical protein